MGNDTAATSQQDKVAATRIIAYGGRVKDAVDQLRNNGISETQISFANDVVSGYGTTGTNPTMEVFHASGGAIDYVTPEAKWLDSLYNAQTHYGTWLFSGENSVRNIGSPIGSDCGAAGCSELIVFLPYVKKTVCEQINKLLGLPYTTLPQDASTIAVTTKFAGTFANNGILSDGSPYNLAVTQGCFQGGGTPATGTYHYFQVLIAR